MRNSSHFNKSLTRETLVKIAIRIAVAIASITVVSYLYIFSSLKTQALADLEKYIAQRGIRESQLFELAMDNQKVFAEDVQRRLARMEGNAPVPKIENRFFKQEDGTFRLKKTYFDRDNITGVIGTLGNSNIQDKNGEKTFSSDLRRVLTVAYDMLAQYGPAWRNRFVNLYVTLPENGILMYWPDTPWGLKAGSWEINAKQNLNNTQDGGVVVIGDSSQTKNEPSWSNLYYDYAADTWMVTATQPIYFKGKYILSVSNDILLRELFKRTITEHLKGTYNLIIDARGKLIAHPKFMDAIQAQGGDFPIMDANDSNLKRIFELAKANQHGIIDNADYNEYLAVTLLKGPDWYFITVFPKAIISQRALNNAWFILILGIVLLLLEISILSAVLKSQVAAPLTSLMEATTRITAGDFSIELNVEREDEVGHLAQMFNTMSKEINAREAALEKARQELEERVRERTRELANSRDDLQKAYDDLKVAQSRILQQEKMASIGQLAAGVAHEINNPIGFMLSNLNTLSKYRQRLIEFQDAQEATIKALVSRPQDAESVIKDLQQCARKLKIAAVREDIGELVAESINGGKRVKKIVQNLKSFARLDEDETKPANLNECLESTLNIVWNELKYKCEIIKDFGDLPPLVCNSGQLNQVFTNLLMNAAQAIEEHGQIRICTRYENQSVVLRFEDTGSGIPADKLDRIFEPFFTTKEAGKGTGLGLSIVYDIIKAHRGEISVASEVGKGTTFTITLPVSPGPET